mmetsp:Transcript_35806/g.115436  ORF Transcript_35806/g.115436 Transcript_35806/m.115436 type:complete len:251 (+) Transcript_35806:131-883(+)
MREIEWGRNAWHRGLAGVKSGAQMRSREIRPGPRRGRRVSDAESPAPARPRSRRLAAGGQSFSSVTIVWSESRACTTSSFASSRYLRTCSFPPPGLYSPNDDVYASSLIFAMCELRPSTESIHVSKSTSSGSDFCALISNLSTWKSGWSVVRRPRKKRTRSGLSAPEFGSTVSRSQLSSRNCTESSPFFRRLRSFGSCAAAKAARGAASGARNVADKPAPSCRDSRRETAAVRPRSDRAGKLQRSGRRRL